MEQHYLSHANACVLQCLAADGSRLMQWNIQPTDTASLAGQRYAAYMDDIQPGVRRYNVFWQPFESSGVLPSTQPLSCLAGYQLASP